MEDCPSTINVKWNFPEVADRLLMQAVLDWHYEDQDSHLLGMPLTEVPVNTVIKGTLTWAPHVTLLLQNLATIRKALTDLWSQIPIMHLTGAKKIREIY